MTLALDFGPRVKTTAMGTQDRVSSTGRKKLFNSQKQFKLLPFSLLLLVFALSTEENSVSRISWVKNRDIFDLSTRGFLLCPGQQNHSSTFLRRGQLRPHVTSSPSSTSECILNCGDINPHPGPASSASKEPTGITKNTRLCRFPCVSCGRGVTKASKAISCDECDQWVHARCANVSSSQYQQLHAGEISLNHVCDVCSFSHLPFGDGFADEFEGSVDDRVEDPPKDFLWEVPLKLKNKGLLFLHLNIRSLLPKLAEVKRLLNQSGASVLGLSESWLDESVTDGEVNIDGYTVIRRDRNRNGGGVIVYIKDGLAFNSRP